MGQSCCSQDVRHASAEHYDLTKEQVAPDFASLSSGPWPNKAGGDDVVYATKMGPSITQQQALLASQLNNDTTPPATPGAAREVGRGRGRGRGRRGRGRGASQRGAAEAAVSDADFASSDLGVVTGSGPSAHFGAQKYAQPPPFAISTEDRSSEAANEKQLAEAEVGSHLQDIDEKRKAQAPFLEASPIARLTKEQLDRIPDAQAPFDTPDHVDQKLKQDRSPISVTTAEDSSKASSNPGYGSGPSYWNDRYAKDPEPFEWLASHADLYNMIEDITGGDRRSRILNAGCGNSLITEYMYDDGYQNIVNTDISPLVISQMQARNLQRYNMQWLVSDATQMTFDSGSFDLILDKSVLDTFACVDDGLKSVRSYLAEVDRVLRPGGTFLCISYGTPANRLNLLSDHWFKRYIEIPAKDELQRPKHAYVCRTPEAFAPGPRSGLAPQMNAYPKP